MSGKSFARAATSAFIATRHGSPRLHCEKPIRCLPDFCAAPQPARPERRREQRGEQTAVIAALAAPRWSQTAPRMMTPLRMSCRFASTLFNPMMLLMTPMISTPTSVPPTDPIPPERLVPPMTTAAIASSS